MLSHALPSALPAGAGREAFSRLWADVAVLGLQAARGVCLGLLALGVILPVAGALIALSSFGCSLHGTGLPPGQLLLR